MPSNKKLPLGPSGDYHLPPGYTLAIATRLAHDNETTSPEADPFMPEQFLDRSYSAFVYMPFGGPRRCLGAALASFKMAVVLGSRLKPFCLESLDQREVRCIRRSITMGPTNSVK